MTTNVIEVTEMQWNEERGDMFVRYIHDEGQGTRIEARYIPVAQDATSDDVVTFLTNEAAS